MKTFQAPEIEVIQFDIEDVMTVSGTFNGIPSVDEGETDTQA